MKLSESMDLSVDKLGVRVRSTAGSEVDIRPYDHKEIDGLGGGLANGARFVMHDGVTVTRMDDLAIWIAPRSAYP